MTTYARSVDDRMISHAFGGPKLATQSLGWLEGRRPTATAQSRRPWLSRYRLGAVAGDVLVASLVAVLASWSRFGVEQFWGGGALVLVPALWVAVLTMAGAYRLQVIGAGSSEYRAIGFGFVVLVGLVGVVDYVGALDLPRGFVLPLLPALLVGSLLTHFACRQRLMALRRNGEALLRTVVVGPRESVVRMVSEIASVPEAGMKVVAACVPGGSTLGTVAGVPVFGSLDSALVAVDAFDAQVVAAASHPDLTEEPLRRLGWALAERGVELVVSPGVFEVAGPRISLRPAAGLSLLHIERPVSSGSRIVAKRALDSVGAAVLTLLCLPLFSLVALLIKATSPGPVFFVQERVGIRGETFRMVKFRTMVQDAEARLAAMSRDGQSNAVLFKDRRDTRITSIGRVLRKLSMDELPQLLNVLRGDMSLVGPRPPLHREVDAYEPDAFQRLRVRPGMTGLWQISGRSDLSWEQSLRLDLWYVDNWSPILDLHILVRTFRAVLGGRGAY